MIDNPATPLVVTSLAALAVLGHGWLLRRRLLNGRRALPTVSSTASRLPADPPSRGLLERRSFRIGIVVVAISMATVAVGVAPVLIAVVATLAVRRAKPLVRSRRQLVLVQRDLPAAMELLVLSIHAGLTPSQATRELTESAPGSVRPAFGEVAHRNDRGEPFADALGALPELLGPSAVGLADVIGTADRYGLPLGPVLDQLAQEARRVRRRLDEADARKLPVRLSFPLVACTLPSFVLLAIAPAVIAALSSLGGNAW